MGEDLPAGLVEIDAAPLKPRPVPPGSLLDVLAVHVTHVGPGMARAEMPIGPQHLNQVGVAQGGVIASLADAVAGVATRIALTPTAAFSTIELNANVLRGAVAGDVLEAVARPVHLGRTTIVIQVDVFGRDGDRRWRAAVFRCTQLVTKAE